VLPHPPTLPAADVPQPVSSTEVRVAHDRIRGHVRRTPVLSIEREHLGLAAGAAVVAKLDLLQPTGSFKVRGAVSLVASVMADGGPRRHVVAASGGNFGLAIAWAAARFGQLATIVVPATSPREKIDPLRVLGADVRIVDGYYADALAEAHRIVAETDGLSAHAYDQREVVAGQGTAVAELLEDVDVDTVIVACGGGGLLAGSIASAGPDVRVVAVETPGTSALHAALAAGAPVDVEVSGLAASSLGARRIGTLAWAVRERLHASVLVTDEQVLAAQRRLWRTARLVAEPGGAAALAAILSGGYRPEPDERVAVLVCGANTDPATVVTPRAG
jgi:threonine dehydratase